MNGFEHQRIKSAKLPERWRGRENLEKLHDFLQGNWEQRSVFFEDGKITSQQQFIDFDVRDGIKLKNYIGTICYEGETLNIFPKVYKYDYDDDETEDWKADDLVKNLVTWLNYCNKIEYPFVSIDTGLTNAANLFELLVSVFVHYVRKAVEIAPYRCYQDTYETSSVVKGTIDFKAYVTKQIPNGNYHKVPYTYSNFVFDNSLNQIIKATCKMLHKLTTVRRTQDILRDILIKFGDVSDRACLPSDCDRIRLSRLHKRYIVILSMCKMFLLNKVNSTEMGLSKSYCFLFPAELLFEGFVGGYMKELFEGQATVKCQVSDQYLASLYVDDEFKGRAFNLREDILVQTTDAIIVLDTKYKEIDRFSKIRDDYSNKLGISDADMKQMAVYAIKRNATKMYLLYPLYREEKLETKTIRYMISLDNEYNGKVVTLEVLKVPFVFDTDVETYRSNLATVLNKILA